MVPNLIFIWFQDSNRPLKSLSGFADYRLIIGFAQIAFGICLLIGLRSNKLTLFSSFALTLLMAGALGTRICIGDGFLDSTPAFVYLAINLYIFTNTLKSKI